MSCPNFHKVNARKYYVIGDTIEVENPETGEKEVCMKDYFDYELDIDCACERGKEKGFTALEWYSRIMGRGLMNKSVWHSFGKKSDEMAFNQFEFCQMIYIHDGHYSGANYDWDINICDNMGGNYHLSDYVDVEDFIENIADAWQEVASDRWYGGWNAGLAKMQRKNLVKWLTKMVKKFSDEADDFCRSICEEVYVCGGFFSNGEAVYYKEDSLKGKVNNVEVA